MHTENNQDTLQFTTPKTLKLIEQYIYIMLILFNTITINSFI